MSQEGGPVKSSSSKDPEVKGQEKTTGPSGAGPDGPRLPSISLPKGGGAIRGIGEKFSVNPATGTASLNVPLVSSPGRSGFGPQLSLSYDSGSGNGFFGFGWGLSLPSITRKTDKGLPRYLDGDESDVFLIAGAEDLVPILNASNQRISFDRTLHNVDYKIRLYRPRIEGLFSRIECWTRKDNGVSHWRTITRDNVTTIFGSDENSRIVDPRDERRVYSYLIRFTFDDRGNATQYEYAVDDLTGINRSAAHEANRTDGDRRTQRYPKYIRYGNVLPYFPDWSETGTAVPPPNDWHFQIVFDYGDHRTDAPTPVRNPAIDPAWPIRPDPFSTYRAGFEVRTYRRCERVLLFHQFAGQVGFDEPCLVRSTDFQYSDETTPTDARNPVYTFMESVTQNGYRRKTSGYEQRGTPSLEFFYSSPEVHPEILTLTNADSRENLPEGLDGSRFQWVDLDGEGLSGILTEQNGGWGYKRNLSPINQTTLPSGKQVARAHFGPQERIASLPVPSGLDASQQLLDLTGEGRPELVILDSPVPGYFARTADNDWEPLQTFEYLPRLNWSERNLKFVDLTGDGRADVLITENELYTFYPSLGVEGFGEAERIPTPWDEERGPRVVFADGTQTVSLADISGDGLSDIIRVRNGEVCYWPNLGYGRFGAKVSMDNAPRFADEQSFEPRRIRFADVDGSGTTDLLYIGEDGVQICFNRSGNSWANPQVLAVFPGADNLSSVQAIDLLGNGTACLVWSSPLPAESYASLRYVDLMGSQKPHMMIRTRNNLGAETRVSYAPSTRFYLEDKRAGKSWITRLPFPVQVVERTEIYDWIGRSRFVTRYAYHHGYFDGEEREFRGFGMVEQWDTEVHRDDTLFPEVNTVNEDAESLVSPVLTRTWFHTGAFFEAGTVSQQYAREYWIEPDLRGDDPADVAAREAMLLADAFLETPPVSEPAFEPDELRQAYRALKGSTLRIEVYAEDNTPRSEHPYTVTEQNFTVRRLQICGPNQHAIFLTHPRESFTYHYERRPNDPRVTHNLTLEVDNFGNSRRSVSVGYGRRAGYPESESNLDEAFRTMLAHDQTRLHVSATEHLFTMPVNQPTEAMTFDAYRAPLPCETITAELTGLTPATALFSFSEIDGHWATLWSGAQDILYEDIPKADIEGHDAPSVLGRRIVERSLTFYRRDDLTALLPLGDAQSQAIPGRSYQLAFTSGLLTRIFGARVDDPTLLEGGYVQLPGETGWWIPSSLIFYSAGDADTPAVELAEARSHFYQLRREVDVFGAVSHITYDAYDLMTSVTTDALSNATAAENDYRVLRPFRATDPNGNFSEVAFDCLGRVAGSAVRGANGEGDSLLDFNADLSDDTIQIVMDEPFADPGAILVHATVRFVYDESAYFRTRDDPIPDPPVVYTLCRETHVSDLVGEDQTHFQHTFVYSDGLGRETQHKAQAEPGSVPDLGDNVFPRWVGSGWTIFNNKGKPVRKYEPFFSQTQRFEFNRQVGVSSVIFYDASGRAVATLHPNNTYEKIAFDPWKQETWDANDTVLTDPRNDPDVGAFFQRLLGTAPGTFISWHDQRITGTLGDTPESRAANQDAALKAAAHNSTPAVAHFNSLGRTCLSVVDNGAMNQRYATRTAMDTEGKPLAVFDALGRHAMEFCLREPISSGLDFNYVAGYDVAGRPLYRNSMDGGERRTLQNIVGNSLRTWDARDFAFRFKYDALHRITHSFIRRTGFAETLAERLVYGERHPDANLYLKAKLFRHYDGAGVAHHDRYDFKGNSVVTGRQFTLDYHQSPNWSAIADLADSPVLDLAALDNAAKPLLDGANKFTAACRFDALNRPIQIVTPTVTSGRPSVIQPTYNEANLLERIDVWIRQTVTPNSSLDPTTADIHAVTGIDYDAHGKRLRITFGNATETAYAYDFETSRLTTLTTTRPNTFSANARIVQSLGYFYDPVGNITRLNDSADIQNVVFFNNQRVEPSADYTYDALYRLKVATGREHLGQTGGALNASQQVTNSDSFRTALAHPGDGNAMGNYTETYDYDSAGNILRMIHQVASGGWTRHYSYSEASPITSTETSNRLSATSLPGDDPTGPFSARYEHDDHGNITRMLHLPVMTWDEQNQLQSTARQVVSSGTPETTYYVYAASGDRLRKVTDRQKAPGQPSVRKSERFYLGGLEIYREYDSTDSLVKERETLHVADDKNRVAIVETLTAGTDPAPIQLIRYQHGNHLGTAILELNEAAQVVSYEEYFPFGSSSYQAVRNQTETPKRYRYTGKERDEENDFYYHGARYYSPWLGRWTSTDPAGVSEDINLYVYVANRPIIANDPNGKWANILIGAGIGLLVGGGVELARQLISGEQINPRRIGAAMLGGMVGGAIAGATMGGTLLAEAGGVALGSAVGGGVTRAVNREPTTPGAVAIDVVIGLATFGLVRGGGAVLGRLRAPARGAPGGSGSSGSGAARGGGGGGRGSAPAGEPAAPGPSAGGSRGPSAPAGETPAPQTAPAAPPPVQVPQLTAGNPGEMFAQARTVVMQAPPAERARLVDAFIQQIRDANPGWRADPHVTFANMRGTGGGSLYINPEAGGFIYVSRAGEVFQARTYTSELLMAAMDDNVAAIRQALPGAEGGRVWQALAAIRPTPVTAAAPPPPAPPAPVTTGLGARIRNVLPLAVPGAVGSQADRPFQNPNQQGAVLFSW